MPRKIEIVVYDFAELDIKVQEKVLEKFRHVNIEYDQDWHQPIVEDFDVDMANWGLSVDVRFSGFGSQGDGASFTTDTCDTDLLIRKLYESGHDISETALLDSKQISVSIGSNDNHYAHEYTMNTFVYDEDDILSSEEQEDLTKVIDEWARTKARELYKNLEKYYDELTSDDEVMEYFSNNDFMFLENGKVAAWDGII